MAHKPDRVTRWWRRISLRAKVTGVTVGVLALGLIVTGIGTVPILRNSLIGNINAQLPSLLSTNLAERFFTASTADGRLVFTPREGSPRSTDYVVAFYAPDGVQIGQAGGTAGAPRPEFPVSYSLQQATANVDNIPLIITGANGEIFHAAVAPQEIQGTYYVQLVALPIEEADHIVGTYFGVFTTIALITLLIAALITRGLVTLAFRRLGQVESTAMAISAGDFSQRLTDLEPTTEVGKLNAAINTMLDRADALLAQRDRSVQQMRRFIGDASHELRTPLVSVRGYAELYRMGAIKGEEDTARAMDRIEKEALRMGVLVEDLLALARLDEQRELSIEPLDLRPLAHDAALDVRAAAPRREVRVIDTTVDTAALTVSDSSAPADSPPADPAAEAPATGRFRAVNALSRLRPRPRPKEQEAVPTIDFSAAAVSAVTTPPIVLGEENKVRQVIANLLGNARRFSPDDAPIEIEVGADRRRDVGWFRIVDHGEGIPEQIQEQIFQRFWRADTSRARETGGSGLGLAIVASIVSALRGSVTVDETPGGGATFTVSLPLAPPRATPEHLLPDTRPIDIIAE